MKYIKFQNKNSSLINNSDLITKLLQLLLFLNISLIKRVAGYMFLFIA